MTNVLSVLTPTYNPNPEHLLAAYESLRDQEMPAGWAWEWVVQEDGNTGAARRILPQDPRISHGTGRRLGVALTRNLGVARSRGSLLKNFDQDDILRPGVLARDINILSSNPNVGWTTSRVLDLLADGSTVGFTEDPTWSLLKPGFVADHWRRHNYRLPVHPTTICIRRSLAIALGGWMAVPGSDDTGLLVAASTISDGWMHQDVGLFYRKWHGQVTATAEHTERNEWQLRMSLIDERAIELEKWWRADADDDQRRPWGSGQARRVQRPR